MIENSKSLIHSPDNLTNPLRKTPGRFKTRWANLGTDLNKNRTFILMALPGILVVLVMSYFPMAGIIIAFKDYRPTTGVFGSPWVGLDNFKYLFSTSDALRATVNTLLMNTTFIITTVAVSIALALLLNEVQHTLRARFYQSTLFFPYFLSWVVVSYIVFAFLSEDSGLINSVLVQAGVDPVRWYATPQLWTVILTLVNLWKNAGFWSIVYLAGILAISPELYEAAKIDGANKVNQILHITIPLLMPIIIINVLLSLGRIFYADFGLFFQVTKDQAQLYPVTDVVDTYVYRALRQLGDVGMSSAAGLYQAVVGFILVVISNLLVRRYDPDRALF